MALASKIVGVTTETWQGDIGVEVLEQVGRDLHKMGKGAGKEGEGKDGDRTMD